MTGTRAAAAVVGALLVLGLVAVAVHVARAGGSSPLAHARRLAADEGRFSTALDAGRTFALVSQDLQRAGDECTGHPSSPAARCAALYAGAGYARVSAAGILRCTRPDVFTARATLRRELDVLAGSATAAPSPPPVVSCG